MVKSHKFYKGSLMLRFAPSPTGDMHIGNLRSAVFNYIIAKQRGEKFLVRIEDTDLERNIQDKDKKILEILQKFGLFWDDLAYQSNNFPYHQKLAQRLIDENKAFYCYCTQDFLEQKRQSAIDSKIAFRYNDSWANIQKDTNPFPAIRLKGASMNINFTDEIKGKLEFGALEIDSFVIVRKDGVPTYNFACACDDMLYKISFIVRGEDHTSNTPKQILIQKALNHQTPPIYAHLPIILGEDGKKMSKRDSASSVSWLIHQGFLPEAIINYLISIGNKTPKEIFTLNQAIEWFDIKNIAKSPVKFDIKRLRYLNREHLKALEVNEIAKLLNAQDPHIGAIAKLYLEEASTLSEIREKITKIFEPKHIFQNYEGEDFSAECKKLLTALLDILKENHSALNDYETFKNEAIVRCGFQGKKFFKPLRILLTGESQGIDLKILYPHIRPHLKKILYLKEYQ